MWKDRVLKIASGQQWDHGSLGIELRLGDTRGFLKWTKRMHIMVL